MNNKLFYGLVLVILSCKSPQKNISDPKAVDVSQTVLKGEFLIHRLYTKNVLQHNLNIIFTSENHNASGFSGCNRFSTSYQEVKASISFSVPLGTKMYCNETSELEKEFMSGLGEITKKIIKGDSLYLKNDQDNVVLFALKK